MTNYNSDNKIYILGAGAIGCLWACYLGSRNIPCVLIERSSTTDNNTLQLRYRPVYRKTDEPDLHFSIPSVDIDTLVAARTTITSLIVATKSQHVVDAIHTIKPLLTNNAEILALCNGFGFQGELESELTEHTDMNLLAGVTSDGALINREVNASSSMKVDVLHTGKGTSFLGYWDTRKDIAESKLTQTLTSDCCADTPTPLLDAVAENNVPRKTIEKFFINCAINSLTTVHQCPNGDLLENAQFYSELQKLCAELQEVYNAMQRQHEYDLKEFNILHSASHVARLTSANTSSMLRDRQREKPLELAYLNSYLKELACRLEIATPFADATLLHLRDTA